MADLSAIHISDSNPSIPSLRRKKRETNLWGDDCVSPDRGFGKQFVGFSSEIGNDAETQIVCSPKPTTPKLTIQSAGAPRCQAETRITLPEVPPAVAMESPGACRSHCAGISLSRRDQNIFLELSEILEFRSARLDGGSSEPGKSLFIST
jgi:hypothetical protein